MLDYLIVYVLGVLTLPLIKHRKKIISLLKREIKDAET